MDSINGKVIVVEFVNRDPKRHAVRWDAEGTDGAVSTIYVRKPFFENARKIRITIEEVA